VWGWSSARLCRGRAGRSRGCARPHRSCDRSHARARRKRGPARSNPRRTGRRNLRRAAWGGGCAIRRAMREGSSVHMSRDGGRIRRPDMDEELPRRALVRWPRDGCRGELHRAG
jgi:hypothetical protein